jgi:hypothetical protein
MKFRKHQLIKNKYILLPLILLFSISTIAQNPCNDSLYQVLKNTPLNHMTDREFSYFQEAEKACASFNQTKLQEDTKKENVKKATNAYVAVVLVGLVAALIIPFIILQ